MLKINHVSAYYGQSRALNQVSLEINRGDFTCIIGANGAGKTTLMKTIMGLIRCVEGTITYDGQDITNQQANTRAALSIGYVPEGRRIFPELTVEENLLIGGYCKTNNADVLNIINKQIYEVFPQLKERKSQLGRSLSGGEQQMLAIGRALVLEPKLLLIDEISVGLMPIMVKKAFQVIKDLNDRGITVLLVEQNANMALTFSKYAYVIKTGNIVYEDQSSKLLGNKAIMEAYLGK